MISLILYFYELQKKEESKLLLVTIDSAKLVYFIEGRSSIPLY